MKAWVTVALWSLYIMVITGSDNGLLPNRQQAIIWTSDDNLHEYFHMEFCVNGIWGPSCYTVYCITFGSLNTQTLTHWPLGDLNKILDQ